MPKRPFLALLGLALSAGALLATDPPAGNPAAVAKAMAARYRRNVLEHVHPAASPEVAQALAEPLRALQASWTRLASAYAIQAKYAERLASPSTTEGDRAKLITLLDQCEAALAEQTRMECTVHIALVQSESLAMARRAQGPLPGAPAEGADPERLVRRVLVTAEARAVSLWLNREWDRIALASPWTAWRTALGDHRPRALGDLLRDWRPVPGVGLPCFLAKAEGTPDFVFAPAGIREASAERLSADLGSARKGPAGKAPKQGLPAPKDIRHTHAWHEANRERKEKRREEKVQRDQEEAQRKAAALRAHQAREALEAERVREHAERQRLRAREERAAAHARLVARREARERAEAARARKEARWSRAREAAAMAAADTWAGAGSTAADDGSPRLDAGPGPSPARPGARHALPPTAGELEDLRNTPDYVARFWELAYTDEAAFAQWQRNLLREATAALRPE